MTWYPMDTYDRAKWQESMSRLSDTLQGRESETLLELDDVQGRLALFQQSYVGVKAIRVDEVVGSVDKSEDFDDELPTF